MSVLCLKIFATILSPVRNLFESGRSSHCCGNFDDCMFIYTRSKCARIETNDPWLKKLAYLQLLLIWFEGFSGWIVGAVWVMASTIGGAVRYGTVSQFDASQSPKCATRRLLKRDVVEIYGLIANILDFFILSFLLWLS